MIPGQSIVVTVRLFLNHYPSFSRDLDGHDDILTIKSSYTEQHVGITFFLHSRDATTRASRSLSPTVNRGQQVTLRPYTSSSSSPSIGRSKTRVELEQQVSDQAKTISSLENVVTQLESNHPSVTELVRNKINQEKVLFEGQSEKVLKILQKKDETIVKLQQEIEALQAVSQYDRPGHLQQQLDAEVRAHSNTKLELKKALESIRPSAVAATATITANSKEVDHLREKTTDQAEQIKVLIAELSKLRVPGQHSGISTNSSDEVRRLRGEIQRMNDRYGELEQSYIGLEESISARLDTTARAAGATAGIETSRMSDEINQLKSMLAQARSAEAASKQQAVEAEAKLTSIEREKADLVERAEKLRAERSDALTQLDRLALDLTAARTQRNAQDADDGLKDAHMWWSYIWHELRRQSATNALGIQHDGSQGGAGEPFTGSASAARGPSSADPHNSLGTAANFASVPLFEGRGEAVLVANKLRESLREQAVETALLRQELLGRKLTAKREVEFLKGRLEQLERELVKVAGAARTHKEDKEIQIAEMVSSIRVLSGRGDMHAQLTAARQDLQSERLAVHHLRADVDAYRSMLEAEQEKVAQLRQELSAAQGAVEAFAVFSTLTDLPGVSAATLMEIMSGRIVQQQWQLATAKAHAERSQADARKLQRALESTKRGGGGGGARGASAEGRSSSAPASPSARGAGGGAAADREGDIEALKRRYSGILRAQHMGGRGARSSDAKEGSEHGSGSDDEDGEDVEGVGQYGYEGGGDHPADAYAFSGTAAPAGSWKPGGSADALGIAYGAGIAARLREPADEEKAGDASALSLVVDGDTTPQVLLDSLNAATMAQKMLSQEALIGTLRSQLEDAQESLVRAEGVRAKEADELEGKSRIDIDIAQRRIELLQANVEEAKAAVALLSERNAELQAEAVDRQTAYFETNPAAAGRRSRRSASTTSAAFEIAMLSAGADGGDLDTSTADDVSPPGVGVDNGNGASRASLTGEDRAELDRTKSLLRERTAQLRIVMETLDALQAEGARPGLARAAANRDYLSRSYGAGDVEGAEALFGLTGVSAGPEGVGYSAVSSVDGPWGVQSLVKRVVELTADLTSQNAAMAMEERRASQLEKESQRKTRDIGQLKTALRSHEAAAATMQLHLEALGGQLRDTEKRRLEETGAMRSDNERLAAALRESEIELSAQQVTVEELSRQVELSEQVDQRQWLESVIMKDAETCAKHVDAREHQKSARNGDNGNGNGKSGRVDLRSLMPLLAPMKENVAPDAASAGGHLGVKDLVISLLSQWREQVGPMVFVKAPADHTAAPRGSQGGSLSKAEQRFYQRVCDLVTGANQRCSRALDEARWADCERMKAQLSLRLAQDRLRATAQQLQRYRKRAYACEKVARGDRRHAERKETKLISLLRRALGEQRAKTDATTSLLFAERKERQVSAVARSAERLELRRLQVQVAELEARGGASLRGRDEALSGLEDRIRATEEALQAWFRAELPRLLGGLPLQEEAMATYFGGADQGPAAGSAGGYGGYLFSSSSSSSSSSGYPEGKDAAGGSGAGGSFFGNGHLPISSRLGAAMGMDKSFALAQTLCACKVSQGVRDMQIAGLLEKNYILKERNVELEMVLRRWQADIDETAAELADLAPVASTGVRLERGTHGSSTTAGAGAGAVAVAVETTERLSSQVEEWQRRSQDLEGTHVELKGQLDRARSRLEEMAHLVDLLTSEGDSVKGESTRQLTRVRVELENAHAAELRSVRVASEDDRRSLMEQLDALAGVVEVARLSSLADALASEGKSGSYVRLMAAMKKAVEAREGGRAKRTAGAGAGAGAGALFGEDDDGYGGDNDRRRGGGVGSSAGAGAAAGASAHRQTQTAFVQLDPSLLKGLEDKVGRLQAELEVEKARHTTARAEVSR